VVVGCKYFLPVPECFEKNADAPAGRAGKAPALFFNLNLAIARFIFYQRDVFLLLR
jgi:hypothetical protein